MEVKIELREILTSQTFRQAPKLGSLLQYVCDKALLQEAERVTEYTIGVDVFGKPENFKESKDSNVRVEVHRLRKRLELYYEREGQNRPLRIVIPSGRYTPDFVSTQQEDEEVTGNVVEAAIVAEPPVPEPAAPLPAPPTSQAEAGALAETAPLRPENSTFLFGSIATAVVIALIFALPASRRALPPYSTASKVSDPPSRTQPVVLPAAPAASASGSAIRIMAGYNGPPHTDGSGNVWGADRYFEGGRPATRIDVRTARTNDPLLFQHSRIGDFSYNIPLPPGTYELHLYFIESEYGPEFGNGENDRTFFLHINEDRLTPEIDIESDAMGSNIADERVFKDVHPAPDGKLHLLFESAKGVPMLNALEILPGIPHRQLPVRLVTQPVPFTGHDGKVWQRDNYYLNGQVCPRDLTVAGTPDPGLFAVERYGHFTYAIPVDVHGRYAVTFHFAEFYFGPAAAGHGGVGSRVFNVMGNGVMLLENLDIFKEVGTTHALSKTFSHLKPTAQGKLNLTFEPVVNYALVSGIEVVDETK